MVVDTGLVGQVALLHVPHLLHEDLFVVRNEEVPSGLERVWKVTVKRMPIQETREKLFDYEFGLFSLKIHERLFKLFVRRPVALD